MKTCIDCGDPIDVLEKADATVQCTACGQRQRIASGNVVPVDIPPSKSRWTKPIMLVGCLAGALLFHLYRSRDGLRNTELRRFRAQPGEQRLEEGGVYPDPADDSNLSDEDVAAAARTFAARICAGNGELAAASLDPESVKRRVFAGLPRGSARDQEAMDDAFDRYIPTITSEIGRNFRQYNVAQFIRVHEFDGRRSAIIFVRNEIGGGFFVILPVKVRRGEVLFADYLTLSYGIPLSHNLRTVLLRVGCIGPDAKAEMNPAQKEYSKAVGIVAAANAELAAGRSAEAARIIRSISPSLADEKHFLRSKLVACAAAGDPDADDVMRRYEALYPDDRTMAAVRFAYYLNRRKWSDAAKAAREASRSIGGSSYFDALESQSLFFDGRIESAATVAASAIADDGTLTEACWTLVAVECRKKEYARAVQWLNRIRQATNRAVSLPEGWDFGGLRDSAEYRGWREGNYR